MSMMLLFTCAIATVSIVFNVYFVVKLLKYINFVEMLDAYAIEVHNVSTRAVEVLTNSLERITRVAELPLAADDEFVVSVARAVNDARDATNDILIEVKHIHDMYDTEDEDD